MFRHKLTGGRADYQQLVFEGLMPRSSVLVLKRLFEGYVSV